MTDVRQLETSFLITMSLVLDELVHVGSIPADSLVASLDQAHHRMTVAGFSQSAGHMNHFRAHVLARAAQRKEAELPPGST